ncbi:MAG: type IV secretory system conjugative DNA transfer family protein [Pseudomonadota bacterium]
MGYYDDTFDTRGLASFERGELNQFSYINQEAGFFLGSLHNDVAPGQDGHLGIEDDRHVFIIAGSRSGKGTSLLIPNLLRWPGGIFCIDPKGENAAITAMRRANLQTAQDAGSTVTKCLGQKVAILDPLGTVKGPAKALCVDYNPFIDIDLDDHDGAAGEMETFCEAVVMPEDGTGAHWTESAATVLAGTIELALHKFPRSEVSWPMIRNFVLDGLSHCDPVRETYEDEDDLDKDGKPKAKTRTRKGAFIADLEAIETPEGLAYMAATILEAAGPDERGSITSTLMRQLKWLNDRRMMKHLSGGGGFSLKEAVRENWSVYVCIPPAMINRFRRWLRLTVGIALSAKTESPFDHEGPQMLFILDEFAALGAFSQIETGASNLAGYGVKLVTVIQNIGQLQNTYRDNWETFLGNSSAIIAWGLNDAASEEYISNRLGKVMEERESYSHSSNMAPARGDEIGMAASGVGSSVSTGLVERMVLWPHEVREFGARERQRAFVITPMSRSFTIRREDYHQDEGQGLFDSPKFIKAWEQAKSQT